MGARKADGINYNYYQNGKRILYIRRRSDTDRRVINIQYFDHYGKLLKVSWFDSRGLSRSNNFMTGMEKWQRKTITVQMEP